MIKSVLVLALTGILAAPVLAQETQVEQRKPITLTHLDAILPKDRTRHTGYVVERPDISADLYDENGVFLETLDFRERRRFKNTETPTVARYIGKSYTLTLGDYPNGKNGFATPIPPNPVPMQAVRKLSKKEALLLFKLSAQASKEEGDLRRYEEQSKALRRIEKLPADSSEFGPELAE